MLSRAHVAKASPGNALFGRHMRHGMLSQIFKTDFTGELLFAVHEIGRAVTSLLCFDGGSHQNIVGLVNLIVATLRSRMSDNDIAFMTSVHPKGDHEAKSESFLLPRQSSLSSLARSPSHSAKCSGDRQKNDFSKDGLADPLYIELAKKMHPKWDKAWHHWAQKNATPRVSRLWRNDEIQASVSESTPASGPLSVTCR